MTKCDNTNQLPNDNIMGRGDFAVLRSAAHLLTSKVPLFCFFPGPAIRHFKGTSKTFFLKKSQNNTGNRKVVDSQEIPWNCHSAFVSQQVRTSLTCKVVRFPRMVSLQSVLWSESFGTWIGNGVT